MALSEGSNLGRYQLLARIGEGGMGEVWKARDSHLDRDVAIKVLSRGALDDEAARQRFRREAHVLSRLSHPGVATIFDFDTQEGADFLVMEYVPGGTLESRLKGGPLLSRDSSVPPGTYSITRKSAPSWVSKSKIVATPGWDRRDSTCASRRKRWRAASSSSAPRDSTLIATSRSRWESRAFQTSPMPPSPIRARSW